MTAEAHWAKRTTKTISSSDQDLECRMPVQVYNCPVHGKFDVRLTFASSIPEFWLCPVDTDPDCCGGEFCDERSQHVLSAPAAIVVEGGK